MKGYVLFSAILCLLCTIVVLSAHWLSILLLIIWVARLLVTRRKKLIIYSCLLVSLTLLIVSIEKSSRHTELSAEEQLFLITLDPNDLKIDGDQVQFYGTVTEVGENKKVSEKVVVFYRLSDEEEKLLWQKQRTVEKFIVSGLLTEPEQNRNLNQFNYQQYLYRNNLFWILEAETITPYTNNYHQTFFEKLNIKNIRQILLSHIDNHTTPTVSSYIKTLLFADTSSIENQVMNGYKEIGIIHLLSISGLHIQFLITGLTYSLWRIGISRERTYLILLFLLLIYGSLTGWGTSIFRAISMSLISQTGSRLERPISGMDTWSWTLIIGLWVDPYQIFSVGFQLSYLLSLALILFSNTLFNQSKFNSVNSLVISFVLTLISVPILSIHFFEFSWVGIFANIIFVPLFAWIVMPMIILLFFSSFIFTGTIVFDFFIHLTEWIVELMEWIVLKIALFPYGTIVTGKVPLSLVVLTVSALIILLISLEKKQKRKRSIILFMLILSVFIRYQTYNPYGEVIVLDVGQGDAILIKEPYGKGVYLIDTGGSITFEKEDWQIRKKQSTVASRVLVPVIKSLGVATLDQVFITHSDEDHMGALMEMAQSIKIKELVFPKSAPKKQQFYDVITALEKKGVRLTAVTAETNQKQLVGPSLAVLWPVKNGIGGNNDSLVLYGKIGEYYWLFTGDIEEEGELELTALYPNLRVDILKVAHHGSQTSTSQSFIEGINPKAAIISCGLNNRYGHPKDEVLNRLEDVNALVYRTDLQGSFRYRYITQWNEIKGMDFQTILK